MATDFGYYDDDWDEPDDSPADDGDWREGECDGCTMQPGETVPPFGLHCACWGGAGADRENCRCPWGEDG